MFVFFLMNYNNLVVINLKEIFFVVNSGNFLDKLKWSWWLNFEIVFVFVWLFCVFFIFKIFL